MFASSNHRLMESAAAPLRVYFAISKVLDELKFTAIEFSLVISSGATPDNICLPIDLQLHIVKHSTLYRFANCQEMREYSIATPNTRLDGQEVWRMIEHLQWYLLVFVIITTKFDTHNVLYNVRQTTDRPTDRSAIPLWKLENARTTLHRSFIAGRQ